MGNGFDGPECNEFGPFESDMGHATVLHRQHNRMGDDPPLQGGQVTWLFDGHPPVYATETTVFVLTDSIQASAIASAVRASVPVGVLLTAPLRTERTKASNCAV